jgi:hypothetical protein
MKWVGGDMVHARDLVETVGRDSSFVKVSILLVLHQFITVTHILTDTF